MVDDDLSRKLSNARPLREFIAEFPVSAQSKAQLVALFEGTADPLAGKTGAEKTEILERTSYRDYLTKVLGCSEEVANCFQGRTLDFFAVGCDAVAASDARYVGYPGFRGLGLPAADSPERNEPYIYHFPDGNASLARLLVRAMIPGVSPGRTMDDIVLAPFDYAKLDRDGTAVRLRLDSTCVHVRNVADGVELGYVRHGIAHRVAARHAVLACFNMLIPYIMPEVPAAQRAALAKNIKAPLVYTKVLVRNWHPWVKLGVHEITAPMSIYSRVKLDYPVSLGGYRHPRDPAEPMCLHMVYVPVEPGHDARTQFIFGRSKLLAMEFADFEREIRDQLDRMLGAGGFSGARDIAAITVNRWSHGYAYTPSPLYDRDFGPTMEASRQRIGRVAIANSDAGWDAYAHVAIDQADRAVRELLG